MIEFFDNEGVLGTVTRSGDRLVADALVQTYADSWAQLGRDVREFEAFYDGWSNGYVHARRVGDET